MAEPHIPFKTPVTLELEPDNYWWCACVLSQNKPFCDKSHRREGLFSPVEFTIDRRKRVKLCRCKHTHTPPYCDNTHRSL